jgi:hypothetical protein
MSASEPRDVARLRESLASLDRGEGGSPVDAGRIFEAVHGEMSPEARAAVVEELISSPEAAEAWRLAKDLQPESTQSVRVPAGTGFWRWAPIAAALVVAIGVGWQVLAPWGDTRAPVYRDTGGVRIESELAEGAELPRANPVLRWTSIEGARYRVRVLTADLEPVEEAEDLTVASYTLSAEAVTRLPAGTRLLWQVEARLPGGATVASPTFGARLD